MSRFDGHRVALGQTHQVTGALDRQQFITQTLDRLRTECLDKVALERQRLLAEARQEANTVMSQAFDEAARIIKEADINRNTLLQSGFNEGHDAGYLAGMELAEQEMQTLLETTHRVLDATYDARQRTFTASAPTAIALIRHIATRITGDALNGSPETLQRMIDAAIASLTESAHVRVVLNQDALQALRQHRASLAESIDAIPRITLEGDPLLDADQVVLLTDEGHFDISPASQIKQLTAPLLQEPVFGHDFRPDIPEEEASIISDPAIPLALTETSVEDPAGPEAV